MFSGPISSGGSNSGRGGGGRRFDSRDRTGGGTNKEVSSGATYPNQPTASSGIHQLITLCYSS